MAFAASAQVDTVALKKMSPNDLKKMGKNAMLQNDYGEAIPYYEQYLKLKKNDYKIQFNLAECYRHERDYTKAEAMYGAAYKSNPQKNITALYFQAQMLEAKGSYDLAKQDLQKFKKEYKGNDRAMKKSASKEIEYIDSAKIILTLDKKVIVQHLDTSINKVHVEASPVTLDEKTLLFSSLRTEKHEYIVEGDTNNALVRKFYTAKKVGEDWKFQGEWDANMNVPGESSGNATFTPDGKKMYFTRCKPNWAGQIICAIYVSENNNGTWSEPQKLDKHINNPKYNSTQPAVAIDEKGNEIVYFVSNRKDGSRGGNDIWYFIYNKKKKTYREPKNVGTKINTSKEEMSPFFDQETHTLYFSSEGWAGLGGHDVYKSVGDQKKWTIPENLGKPINSGADDIFYTVSKNREEGFFVSNREGGNALKNSTCCDDIYQYKHTEYIHLNLIGNVTEMFDSVVVGTLKDAVIEVYIKDVSGEKILVKTSSTDQNGKYDVGLEAGKDYVIVARKDGFINSSQDLSTRNISTTQTLQADFTVNKLPKGPVRIKNIQYEFDRSELTANSKTIIDTTIYKLLIENPKITVELSSHTDSKGADTYNQKLSQKRAESVVNYLIAKGIDSKRLTAVGYGETKPIAPNQNPDGSDNPEGRQQNRRTEFRVTGEIDLEIINEDE
jgi:outer membrane protein OmpA-like peptidoglycan-associated protein